MTEVMYQFLFVTCIAGAILHSLFLKDDFTQTHIRDTGLNETATHTDAIYLGFYACTLSEKNCFTDPCLCDLYSNNMTAIRALCQDVNHDCHCLRSLNAENLACNSSHDGEYHCLHTSDSKIFKHDDRLLKKVTCIIWIFAVSLALRFLYQKRWETMIFLLLIMTCVALCMMYNKHVEQDMRDLTYSECCRKYWQGERLNDCRIYAEPDELFKLEQVENFEVTTFRCGPFCGVNQDPFAHSLDQQLSRLVDRIHYG